MIYRAVALSFLLAACAVPPCVADDSAAEGGVLLRDGAVHAQPDGTSAVIGRLPAGSAVDVLAREGLWMYVTPAEGDASRGWLRLTGLRLTGVPSATPAQAGGIGGGFARLSRSVSGLLSGFRGREQRTAHATIGIRGLTPGELQTAQFDDQALAAVSAASATPAQAEQFARAGGLASRHVEDLEPVATLAEGVR